MAKKKYLISVDEDLREGIRERFPIPFSAFVNGAMRLSSTWNDEKTFEFIKEFCNPYLDNCRPGRRKSLKELTPK